MSYNLPRASRNQMANTQNPYQGKSIKALCVCSAGLLRSPTIAKFLTGLGYNTRACGTSQEYALVSITEALLSWCDEIHVVQEQVETVVAILNALNIERDIHTYAIPDEYGTFDPTLEEIIKQQFEQVE